MAAPAVIAPVRPTVEEVTFHLPITDEQALKEYVTMALGITIPATKVCAHHSTPWEAFAEAYFARVPVSVWVGSRGFGGKSFLLAALGLVEAQTLKCDVSILGGSGEQSKRVHEYQQGFWRADGAPRQLLASDPIETRTRLVWGNRITALKASEASVRGPHVPRLRIDEGDVSTLSLVESALGQTMSRPGVPAHTLISSTHHIPDGVMTEMLRRAATMGWSTHRWCYRETSNPIDGWLPTSDVERKRSEMTAAQFAIEEDLAEPSAEGRAILAEAVDWTFRAELGVSEGAVGQEHVFEQPEPGARYATGADWARKTDMTVIDTLRIDCRPHRRVAWARMNRLPWPVMVERFNQRCTRYPGTACHDGTGVGDAAHEWITGDAEAFVMTGRPRQELFTDYIAALESQALVSPKIAPCEAAHRYCIAAGMPVLTAAGLVPIEHVRLGALVATRAGWRRVRSRTFTGVRPVLAVDVGAAPVLQLTADHRVATPDGWRQAGALFVGALVCGVADAAAPRSSTIRHDRILGRERMAALTVRGDSLLRDDTRTSEDVHFVGDGFKVVGIAAAAIGAEVVDLAALGDRAFEDHVGETRGDGVAADIAAGVPVAVGRSRPVPATRRCIEAGSSSDVALVENRAMDRRRVAWAAANAPLAGDRDPAIEARLHVVTNITPCAPVPVYDLEVEDEHEFIAAGIVVHNCTTEDLYRGGHPPDELVAAALAYRAASRPQRPAFFVR